MISARTWLVWSLVTMIVAVFNRNPLYAILLLFIAFAVEKARRRAQSRRLPLSARGFAAVAIGFSSVYNGLSVHIGNTVLFHLPASLPLVGGPITLETIVFGATNGLTVAIIFADFAVFNQMTATHDLVRLTPRGLREVGLVLSIALTFIPQSTASLAQIREAQAVRGHRMRGLRDWLPIVVPLVVLGLERSMGLAEAMVARGYESAAETRRTQVAAWLLLLGVVAVFAGWVGWLFDPAQRWIELGSVLGGAGLIGGLLYGIGAATPHTTYHAERLTRADGLIYVACAVTVATTILPTLVGGSAILDYSPYPGLTPPDFSLLAGVGLLALIVPAIAGTPPRVAPSPIPADVIPQTVPPAEPASTSR